MAGEILFIAILNAIPLAVLLSLSIPFILLVLSLVVVFGITRPRHRFFISYRNRAVSA